MIWIRKQSGSSPRLRVTRPDPIDRIRTALSKRGGSSSDFDLNPNIRLPDGRKLREAAVLVGFMPNGDLILTKRASHLKHHPGQIAFPGGKRDASDISLDDTAKREATEEIGLLSSSVQVLGQLPTHETVTSFVVTPVVGFITGPFDPVPELGEVDEVFRVPFDHIANPANFRIESRRWQGRLRYFYTVPFGPYYIWGATARILRGLADRLQ